MSVEWLATNFVLLVKMPCSNQLVPKLFKPQHSRSQPCRSQIYSSIWLLPGPFSGPSGQRLPVYICPHYICPPRAHAAFPSSRQQPRIPRSTEYSCCGCTTGI